MDILAVQQRLIDAGFQFQEHVFNDDKHRNCFIKITRVKSPHAFDIPGKYDHITVEEAREELGWGRFPRVEAWRLVAEWLDEHHPL